MLGIVSVPLRGCGFEIENVTTSYRCVIFVSVPLRGCGFEIRKLIRVLLLNFVFPSPYGDVVLK